MTSRLLPPVAVALLALSACNNSDKAETVTLTAPDPMKDVIANRAPVELPPAMKAEVTMRCKDNSLVYVTFFEGDKMAVIKTAKDGPVTKLTADKAGDPLKAEGYSMTGTPKSISLTAPGKGTLSCHP
ncbi:MAG: hypothetical protein V4472_00890 [Pseudomonadota bacterium]